MNRSSRSILTLVAAGLLTSACGGQPEAALEQPGEPVRVQVSYAQSAPDRGSFPATVEASETVRLATRTSGTIRRISVDVGSRVRSGDTLVVLDQDDMRARIAGARSQARVARKAYERIESLAADGAASEQELDEATARLESAESALEEAMAQEAYSVLRAPFAGVVTDRRADAGDLAVPGQPILTLSGGGRLQVRADLPARLAGSVRVGDALPLIHDGRALTATVTRVVPALERETRRFRVEARLSSGSGVLPGAYARLGVTSAEDATVWIPADAVVRSGQLTGVYTVENERLRLRWVRLGEDREGAVELLSGWVGERPVVRRPERSFTDGIPVSEMEEETWSVEAVAPAEGGET